MTFHFAGRDSAVPIRLSLPSQGISADRDATRTAGGIRARREVR